VTRAPPPPAHSIGSNLDISRPPEADPPAGATSDAVLLPLSDKPSIAVHARLGDRVRANASAEECPSMTPEFSIAPFMDKLPLKNPVHAAQIAASLRMANRPE